jgi:hypothetical protein
LSRGDEREFPRFVLKNAIVTTVLFGGDRVSRSCSETLTISAAARLASDARRLFSSCDLRLIHPQKKSLSLFLDSISSCCVSTRVCMRR